MSKADVLAAALIGAGLGQEHEYYDKFDDTDANQDVLLITEAAYYAPIAVAMVDAAFGVAFQHPEDHLYTIFRNFGETLSDHTGSDSNGHELPNRSDMLDELEENVYNAYEPLVLVTQHESLKLAITQARQEAA